MSFHVCFVVPHVHPLLDPDTKGVFGGSEVRAWMFGTALARVPGYRVSFITMAPGEAQRFERQNVHICTYDPSREVTVPKTYSRLFQQLRRYFGEQSPAVEANSDQLRLVFEKTDADVYCAFGASDYTGLIADLCDERNCPLVLFCGSDHDVSAHHRKGVMHRNQYGSTGHGAWRAISGARLVVTQTRHQAHLLEECFGRVGVTIPNPIDLEQPSLVGHEAAHREYVLWVGKADRVKRPEVAASLASAFPDLRFVMVVNRVDETVWRGLIRARPQNVEIIESLPLAQTEALFKQALSLLNTSSFEGFPNTFLQAGKYGVPILSLSVDPDQFIVRTGSGIVCNGDPSRLESALRRLSTDAHFWHTCSTAVHNYVKAKHELNGRIKELDAALRQVVEGQPASVQSQSLG